MIECAMKDSRRRSEDVGLVVGLLSLIILLRPLSSWSVHLTDKLTTLPRVNDVMAVGLVMLGFVMSYIYLRSDKASRVQRSLLCYVYGAVGMAGIYYLVYTSHPGCYSFSPDFSSAVSVLDFVYFSFVTVTTLGYGDIVPNHTFVRLLVVMQILFGAYLIFYETPGKTSRHSSGGPVASRSQEK